MNVQHRTSNVELRTSRPLLTINYQPSTVNRQLSTFFLRLLIINVSIALILFIFVLPVSIRAEVIKVMTANLNSGVPPYSDWYRDASINIFKGLEPDIVLIQEFNVDSGTTRPDFIAGAFGGEFYYYCEPEIGGTWAMPNGIISRWPIKSSGQWSDSQPAVTNRSFVWAVIDIPGDIDLQVVSIHLKAGDSTDDRQTREAEAGQLKGYVEANFDDNKYIIVGGDLNLQYDGEPPFSTFSSYLDAADHRPRDRTGDVNTNSTGPPRTKPYDWIMPNELLDNHHTTIYIGSDFQSFPEGIVFDSEIFTSLETVPPIEFEDSRQSGCTHMAVMKAFDIASLPTPAPTPPQLSSGRFVESGDYNGDGTSDIAIFRPGMSLWAVRGVTRIYFGSSDDGLVSGDYSGAGTADIAIFRGSSGLWAIRGLTRFYYGTSVDIPVPGDYNGDGICDAGIFRNGSGLWSIRGVTRSYFGASSDQPVPGDYNGDGTVDIGIFRRSVGMWALRGISRVYFGCSGDTVAPGDYNGDGAWECGIYRTSSGLWAIRGVTRACFGSGTYRPVPADYKGSGMDDIGVFRDASGVWAIRGVTRVYYGTVEDIPVTR